MKRVESKDEYMRSVIRMERSKMKCIIWIHPEIVYRSSCQGRIDRAEGLARIYIEVEDPDSGGAALCGDRPKAPLSGSH